MKFKDNNNLSTITYDYYEAKEGSSKLDQLAGIIVSGTLVGGIIGFLTFLPVSFCVITAISLGFYNVLKNK